MRENQYNDFLSSGYQKRKAGLSKQQIEVLASIYMANKKPNAYQRLQIAERLSAEEDKIKNWFQNRRAKDKKMHRKNKMLEGLDGLEGAGETSPKMYPDCNDLYRRR